MRVRAETLILPICFIITRMIGHPRILYNTDAIQFALAIDDFDLTVHQPHPPGYIWFVLLARIFRMLGADPMQALILTGILIGLVTLILLQGFVRLHFGRVAGLFAGLIFCFSPMSWFFSVIGLNYIADALIAVVTLCLFYKPAEGSSKPYFVRALIGAAILGFRPQALIFVLPVWLYFIFRNRGRRNMLISGFILGIVLWVGVTMLLAGEWNIFAPAVEHAFRPDVTGGSNLMPSLAKLRIGIWQMKLYTMQTLTLAGILLAAWSLLYLAPGLLRGRFRKFFLLWTLPHILFSLLIFIIQPGHFVYLVPAFAILIAVPLGKMFESGGLKKIASGVAVVILVFTMLVQYTSPVKNEAIPNVGLGEIIRNDNFYVQELDMIRGLGEPETSLVLTEDFRHVFYYLPEYRCVGFFFGRIKQLGDNPMVMHSGVDRNYESVSATVYDTDNRIYRMEIPAGITQVVYFGRGKWRNSDEEYLHIPGSESVGILPVNPGEYIYFAAGRKWWAGEK